VHIKNVLAKTIWVSPTQAKANLSISLLLLKDLGALGGRCGRMGESDVYLMGIRNLIWWKMSLLVAGGLELDDL